MNRIFLSSILVSLVASVSGFGQDVIVLKNGQYAAVEIEALTDNIVTFTLAGPGRSGEGVARRTINTSEVDYVEFDFEVGEEEAFAARETLDLKTVESWWNHHFSHLHRPRSRTAAWGIALGYALLRENPDTAGTRALQLFERIAEKAWADEDVAAAKRGRLRAMMALGDLERAIEEANILAGQTEDPELLIEVKHLLAQADFARLKEIEEEHPRWMEDDEVRPERNALYHGTIDQFLWPYLFHAAREAAASRGLLAAGEVYAFGGDEALAINALRDLVALYPTSKASELGKERLEALTRPPSEEISTNPDPSNQ